MAPGLKRALLIAATLAVAAPQASGAEMLADPTRPPFGMAGEKPEPPRRPVLQSIIITPHSRAAIIDDERVELHGRFRDAEVARITENEVVLKSTSGIETLRMYPGVDKAPHRREAQRIAIERKGDRGEKQ